MAGSYSHIVNDDGSFAGTELLDHMGDAYEALEECYWMIQYLAGENRDTVEAARTNAQKRLRDRAAGKAPEPRWARSSMGAASAASEHGRAALLQFRLDIAETWIAGTGRFAEYRKLTR